MTLCSGNLTNQREPERKFQRKLLLNPSSARERKKEGTFQPRCEKHFSRLLVWCGCGPSRKYLTCGNLVPRVATLEDGRKHKGLGRSSVQGNRVSRAPTSQELKEYSVAAGLVLLGMLLQRSEVPIVLPPGSSALHQSPGFLSHHVISFSLLQPSRYPSRCDTTWADIMLFAFFRLHSCELKKLPRPRVFSYSKGEWANTGTNQWASKVECPDVDLTETNMECLL